MNESMRNTEDADDTIPDDEVDDEVMVFEGHYLSRNYRVITSSHGMYFCCDSQDKPGVWRFEGEVQGVAAADWREALYRRVHGLPQLPERLPSGKHFTAELSNVIDRKNRLTC